MRTDLEAFGDVTVLRPQGRIDMETSPPLQDSLLPLVERDAAKIVVDLAAVPYMSSAGLRALMVAAKAAKSRGGQIVVCGLSDIVAEVFRISRFHLLVPVHADVDAARAALSGGGSGRGE